MPRKPPNPLAKAHLAYENDAFLNSPDGRILRILAEYSEPLARFRRERIQDTVVFFGSARFRALDEASADLELLENTGSQQPAPEEEQPSREPEVETSELRLRRAEAAVEMAHYYEDARQLAFKLTQWAKDLKSRRNRFVVCSGGGPGIMEAANRWALGKPAARPSG
jgi:predicted Rossmann-fold nucleotide-binding protein